MLPTRWRPACGSDGATLIDDEEKSKRNGETWYLFEKKKTLMVSTV
jgi:hypothetical protein